LRAMPHANRFFRKLISLASSLVIVAGVCTAGFFLVAPTAANAATTVTICLTSATSYCADVKDSDDVSGQPVWLYKSSQANDYHWVMVTGVSCIAGSNCYNFEDAQKTSLCLSVTSGRSVVLGTCNGGAGSWYSEGGNLLGNGAYGASYTLMVANDTNSSLLDGLPAHTSGYWERWNY
jgi:hypothetical protein